VLADPNLTQRFHIIALKQQIGYLSKTIFPTFDAKTPMHLQIGNKVQRNAYTKNFKHISLID